MSNHKTLVKNLTTLNQIVEKLNQTDNIDQALDFALTRLIELMELETGWIFLKDAQAQTRWAGKGFVLAAQHNLPPALGINRARAWKGTCECQLLCNKDQLTGAYNEVSCSRLRNAPGDRRGLLVHASVPLRSGNDVLGILNVAAEDWESFSEESLILLANVGSQMGIALERSRLFELLKERRIHEQAVLLELSNQLLSRSDLDDLMNFLVERVAQLLDVDACAILLPDSKHKRLKFCAAWGWYNNPVTAGREIPLNQDSASGLVMSTLEPLVVEDFSVHDPTPWTADWLTSEDFRGHTLVPLVAEEHAIGVFMIDCRMPRILNEDELRLLHLMANQAAIAIEKVRLHQEEITRQRLEDELAVGQQIQMSLLPECCPQVEGWEFAAYYKPAQTVGGDFYDYFQLAGDPMQLGLVMADVSGKGVPAALFMALSRSLIRTKSMTGRHPAAVLTRANRLILKDSRSNLFLTAFYATLDLRTGWLAYASGGHNYPLWLRAATGKVTELAARGIVLGAFEDIELEEQEITMAPGDHIILYTDGVTEAINQAEELFGEERLIKTIEAKAQVSAQEIQEAIVEKVQEFIGDTPQADDLTLFIVKRQL